MLVQKANVQLRINPDELQKYLNDGFVQVEIKKEQKSESKIEISKKEKVEDKEDKKNK